MVKLCQQIYLNKNFIHAYNCKMIFKVKYFKNNVDFINIRLLSF